MDAGEEDLEGGFCEEPSSSSRGFSQEDREWDEGTGAWVLRSTSRPGARWGPGSASRPFVGVGVRGERLGRGGPVDPGAWAEYIYIHFFSCGRGGLSEPFPSFFFSFFFGRRPLDQ